MFKSTDYSVAYGKSEVVHAINMEVKEKEIVAVLGRNGMGKTTLMKSAMGILPHSSGELFLNGDAIHSMKSYERVAKGLAFVPQGRMIFSSMTVKENIETGLTTAKSKRIPEVLYELFPVLKEMRNSKGGNLSGGQQQQLAIARALATEPKMLILDEPTEGIQPSIIREMARTLKRIRDEMNLSILVSEQVLSFALDIADRILVIEKGALVREELRESVDQEKIASYLAV